MASETPGELNLDQLSLVDADGATNVVLGRDLMDACQLKLNPDALGRVTVKLFDSKWDRKVKSETVSSIDSEKVNETVSETVSGSVNRLVERLSIQWYSSVTKDFAINQKLYAAVSSSYETIREIFNIDYEGWGKMNYMRRKR